jgi:hypothetical protein
MRTEPGSSNVERMKYGSYEKEREREIEKY